MVSGGRVDVWEKVELQRVWQKGYHLMSEASCYAFHIFPAMKRSIVHNKRTAVCKRRTQEILKPRL